MNLEQEYTLDSFVELLILALVILVPLSLAPFTYDIFGLTKLTLLRLFTLAIVSVWLIKLAQNQRLAIKRHNLDIPLSALISVAILSTIFSAYPTLSLYGEYNRFEGLLTIINYIALYYIAVIFITKPRQIYRIVTALIISANVIAVYGISQHFGIDFIKLSPSQTDLSRSLSTLGNPIFLAAYLVIALSLILSRLLHSNTSRFEKLALSLSFALLFACLIFTSSRAGWIGFAVALGFICLATNKKLLNQNKYLLIGLLSTMLCIVLLANMLQATSAKRISPAVAQRAASTLEITEGTVASRLIMWKSSLSLIANRPVLGWGLETFRFVFTKYRKPDLIRAEGKYFSCDRPHNDFLQVTSTLGLLGLVAYLWFIFTFLVSGIKSLKEVNKPGKRGLLIGFLAAWFAYLIQVQFSFNFVGVAPLFWLSTAFVATLGEQLQDRQIQFSWKNKPTFSSLVKGFSYIVAPAVLLLLTIFAIKPLGADYYFEQGVELDGNGQVTQAEQHYASTLKLNPEEFYLAYLGNRSIDLALSSEASQKLFHLEKAINYYQDALKLQPLLGGNWYNLGNAYYYYAGVSDPKKINQAILFYKKALSLDPTYTDAYINLASAYEKRGMIGKAIQTNNKALELEPNNNGARKNATQFKLKQRE